MRGDLIKLDPESERGCGPLATVIAVELSARLAAGDAIDTPEGIAALAELVADSVLDVYAVRRRSCDAPRYRWEN